MAPKAWNPYYVAYARSQGRPCDEQLEYDKKKWPGGRMAGFMLWMREAWSTWSKESGESRVWDGAWSTDQRQAFTIWLEGAEL